MNKEGFLNTLRTQYVEEIRAAYSECQHAGRINYIKLNSRLSTMAKYAQAEGLPVTEFEELVKTALPDMAGHGQVDVPVRRVA